MLHVEANTFVTLGGRTGGTKQQLTAHAEVRDDADRFLRRLRQEREPQELAAARGRLHRPPRQSRLEVGRGAGVPCESPVIEHRHGGHPGAADGGGEARTDDLDLGQLRHAR